MRKAEWLGSGLPKVTWYLSTEADSVSGEH